MKTASLGIVIAVAACVGTEAPSSDSSSVGDGGGGKADDGTAVRGLPADLAPWGGADRALWTPEAVVANAATAELQRDPTTRVSIPAQLWTSQHAPFGDGQTNAAIGFGAWTHARPPVVGVRRGGRIAVRFDRALPYAGDTFEVWSAHGAWVRSVTSTRTVERDWLVSFATSELPAGVADRLVVSPRGWRDGFPLAFALPITSIAALAAGRPTQLPGGEPVVDPVGAAAAASDGRSVRDVLHASSFPTGFVNQTPYYTETLHAAFPQSGAPRVTAVGGAATWVAEAPFKNMYVCLDRRAAEREAQYGVPSGAGWHHIGDPGEALLASLESSALLVGHATANGIAPPAGGGFAYGASHATTFALLQPGDAFTTVRGDFHWYAVHHATDPCVQIWAL